MFWTVPDSTNSLTHSCSCFGAEIDDEGLDTIIGRRSIPTALHAKQQRKRHEGSDREREKARRLWKRVQGTDRRSEKKGELEMEYGNMETREWNSISNTGPASTLIFQFEAKSFIGKLQEHHQKDWHWLRVNAVEVCFPAGVDSDELNYNFFCCMMASPAATVRMAKANETFIKCQQVSERNERALWKSDWLNPLT